MQKEKASTYEQIQKQWTHIPERFRGKTFESFKGLEDKVKKIKEAVLQKQSIFISGLCGTGKTHLAIASMYFWFVEKIHIGKRHREEWCDNVDCISYPSEKPDFLPSVEFFLELKNSFKDDRMSEENIINFYGSKELLVIDDVGAEKVSDWSRQMFYTLIDRRYREMSQTIITSNLDLDKLAEIIDERISSRIIEMGKVIKLGGKDWRLNSR